MFRFMWKRHSKREKVLAKCSDKSPFSMYVGFQRNALEFSKCQMLGRTSWTMWWRKSGGREAEFQERIRKEWASLQGGGSFRGFGLECPSVFKCGHHDLENSKLVSAPRVPKVSRNSWHSLNITNTIRHFMRLKIWLYFKTSTFSFLYSIPHNLELQILSHMAL